MVVSRRNEGNIETRVLLFQKLAAFRRTGPSAPIQIGRLWRLGLIGDTKLVGCIPAVYKFLRFAPNVAVYAVSNLTLNGPQNPVGHLVIPPCHLPSRPPLRPDRSLMIDLPSRLELLYEVIDGFVLILRHISSAFFKPAEGSLCKMVHRLALPCQGQESPLWTAVHYRRLRLIVPR